VIGVDEEYNDVEFIDIKTQEEYYSLKKSDPQLFKFITRAIEDLKNDRRAGRPAPKWFIPPKFRKHGIDNVWRYNLPGAWRLLYSIKGSHIKILIILLCWMPHKEYEKKVGLKGRKRR
jgi:hypothetical protein